MTARALTALATVVVAVLAPITAAAAEPTVSISPGQVDLGGKVVVKGTGYAAGTLVFVEVCGNEAKNGSADCDHPGGVDAGVDADGSFAASLKVSSAPPSPCPCVVRASSLGTNAASAPITVNGVPTADPSARAALPGVQRVMTLTDVSISGSGPAVSWFGGPAERVLTFTATNTGNVAVHSPPLSLAVGNGAPTRIIDAPAIGDLLPGEARTFQVPFTIDGPAFGEYTVEGRVAGFSEPVELHGRTTTYPWALLLIPVLGLLQLGLLRARNAARRRLHDGVPPPAAAEQPPAEQSHAEQPRAELPPPPVSMTHAELSSEIQRALVIELEAGGLDREPAAVATEVVARLRAGGTPEETLHEVRVALEQELWKAFAHTYVPRQPAGAR